MPNREATPTNSATVRREWSDPSRADASTERALSGRLPIRSFTRDRGTAGTHVSLPIAAHITKSLTRDINSVILTGITSPTKSWVADDVESVRAALAHILAGAQ